MKDSGRIVMRLLLSLCFAYAMGCSGVHSGVGPGAPSTSPSAPSPAASFAVSAPSVGSSNVLGTVQYTTASGTAAPLFSLILKPASGSLVATSSAWNSSGSVLTVRFNQDQVAVQIQVAQSQNSLDVYVTSGSSAISSIEQSDWDGALGAETIPVPYYAKPVYYSPQLSIYLNSWWDWRTTHATSFSGMKQIYLPKTDGQLNTLSEHLHVTMSANVDSVFPAIGNAPSPYISSIADRVVLDIWDAGFQDIKNSFDALADYGFSHCVAIIHNWQYQGYDNGFPQHYPANPEYGGNAELIPIMQAGVDADCLMALHENYVDYYPDYPQFTPSAIALNSDGSQMLAYYNRSMGIQSYSVRHDQMIPNAQLQSPDIHHLFGTTASYLDGHSAAALNTHGDMNAATARAGMMADWMTSNEALFAYERSAHQGPVFGEGLNHWYYSGTLDGVEAQTGSGGVPENSDASLPLFVDFDLLTIHPLQANHGMGYYARWSAAKTNTLSTLQQDAYRMQEVAFGHAPFLGIGAWNSVPRALVESGLLGPVAARYGPATATAIQYQVNGGWVNSSEAARQGTFTVPKIVYSNGLTVVANAAASTLSWNGMQIPQYGWAARGDDIAAFSGFCKNTMTWCDYAETPTSVFANARNQKDIGTAFGFATPSLSDFKPQPARQFLLSVNWDVNFTLSSDATYKVFVHFVSDADENGANEGIVFQGSYYPGLAISQWSPGSHVADAPHTIAVPSGIPDGTYSIRIGVVNCATGTRAPLSGNDDGRHRYIIGYLTIAGNGAQMSMQPPPALPPDSRLNATGQVLTFDSIKTDGMVLIDQQGDRWRLRAFPRTRAVTVLLNSAKFALPAAIVDSNGAVISPAGTDSGFWQFALNGARSYSWPIH